MHGETSDADVFDGPNFEFDTVDYRVLFGAAVVFWVKKLGATENKEARIFAKSPSVEVQRKRLDGGSGSTPPETSTKLKF